MIVNLNGKLFGISIFPNREESAFSLGTREKMTPPNMISRMTFSENLLKSGWTLILRTRSSPNTTFVVV